jgi:hypothetical protein
MQRINGKTPVKTRRSGIVVKSHRAPLSGAGFASAAQSCSRSRIRWFVRGW